MTAAEQVVAFERSYIERARAELGPRVEDAAAIVPARQPPDDGSRALAGWWCDPDGPEELIVLPNPWDDRAAIGVHAEYSLALARRLAASAGAALDRIHGGPPRAPEYWDLVLGPWLVHVVCAALDRRLFCRAAAALRSDVALVGVRGLSPAATLRDTFDRLLRSDPGNAALLGVLARPAGLEVVEDLYVPPPEQAAPAGNGGLRRLVTATATLADSAMWRAAARQRGRDVALLAQGQMSTADAIRLLSGIRGARLAPTSREAPRVTDLGHVAVDRPAREQLATALGGEELGQLVAAAVPRSLLEDRERLERASLDRYGAPCAVVIGNYRTDEVENHFSGECAEQGCPIVFVQHGGAYLQARVNLQEALERRRDGLFVSWGGGGEGVRPLPSPRLERIRGQHRGGTRIVVIEHMHPPDAYAMRFGSTPMGNQGHLHARLLVDFVEALGPARRHLFLKRFPHVVAGPDRHPALAALPHHEPRPRRGSATALMARARVAIVSYPDTPLIEALVLGVPTVGLWDPHMWELREDAAAPFDALAQAGVVHSDPRAAAAHVDQVYERASEWWGSAEVQAARELFLERFARGGDWLAEWKSLLSDLSASRRGSSQG